jgi:hypothetical protein
MGEWDTHIGSLLELFNLRFAPQQEPKEDSPLYGGITEMIALQREFQIFKVGRPFVESARLLGLGGLSNNLVKNRWLKLLADLSSYDSDKAGENGDQRIVNALIANFERPDPLPCFMLSHDSRGKDARRVLVQDGARPLHYVEQPYIAISLPMRPRRPAPARRSKT